MRPYTDPGGSSVYVPMLSKQTIMGILSVHAAPGNRYTVPQLVAGKRCEPCRHRPGEGMLLRKRPSEFRRRIRQRNKELDDFTYVVSHDLKEPLISVEGFSRILQSDYSGSFEAEGGNLASMGRAAT